MAWYTAAASCRTRTISPSEAGAAGGFAVPGWGSLARAERSPRSGSGQREIEPFLCGWLLICWEPDRHRLTVEAPSRRSSASTARLHPRDVRQLLDQFGLPGPFVRHALRSWPHPSECCATASS